VGRAILLVVLASSLARADATVPAASQRNGAISSVTLFADPLRVPSADRLDLGAQVRVRGDRQVIAKSSVVEVRDSGGRVVHTNSHAFLFGGEGTINLGLGFSSSAGPQLPATLPAGDYVAVWILDGVRSNLARFTVGAGEPPPLVLERTDDGRVIAHVFNPGPGDLALPDSIESSTLLVDGKPFARQGLDWDGGVGLPRGRGWSMLLAPADYGAPAPRHTMTLQLGRFTSNTLTW
jgi:hypothetical protein